MPFLFPRFQLFLFHELQASVVERDPNLALKGKSNQIIEIMKIKRIIFCQDPYRFELNVSGPLWWPRINLRNHRGGGDQGPPFWLGPVVRVAQDLWKISGVGGRLRIREYAKNWTLLDDVFLLVWEILPKTVGVSPNSGTPATPLATLGLKALTYGAIWMIFYIGSKKQQELGL